MRTMKDSGIEWIGQIPQEWRMERLRYHAEWNPTTELPSLTDEDNVSFIPMDHLKTGYHLQSIVSYSKVKKGYVCFADGDVLMAKVTPCLENGNLAIADNLINGVGYGSTEINVIRCKSINNRFLFYLLQCPLYIEKATYSMYGVAGLKRLDPEFIPNSYFPFPPIEEQERIVSFVDKKCSEIDTLIAAKEKTNALLKERRQSIIYEAVTKGLNPDAPMKDSGIEWIGTIPQNSNIVRFKYLCDIFGRIGFRGYTQADIVAEGEGPITLSPSNIEAYGMDFSKCTYLTWDKYNESPEIQVGVGDILLVKTGSSYGKSAIIETIPMEATINPQLVVVKNIKCNARYLYYCMQTDCFAYQVERAVVGGTIPTMAQEKINNFIVVLPEDDLCEEIVVYLDQKCEEINRMVTANEATIQKLKEYRQSVIYEAVTGKIEI